jgi:hypothetical protein
MIVEDDLSDASPQTFYTEDLQVAQYQVDSATAKTVHVTVLVGYINDWQNYS